MFLDNPKVEPTNNRAERQLRVNVIMRKITFGKRSSHGEELSSDHNEHS
ncbi:MAG: IS66 family transposase [Thermodesulfobacteriota bacterium]